MGLAVLFDLFEAVIELATTALGLVAAGAAGGCAIGYHYAGQTGCTIGAAVGGLIGALVNFTGAGELAGAVVGYALDAAFSVIAFVLLLAFLIFTNRMSYFRFMYIMGTFMAKIIPLGNLAPAWSVFAWRCSRQLNWRTSGAVESPAVDDAVPSESYANAA